MLLRINSDVHDIPLPLTVGPWAESWHARQHAESPDVWIAVRQYRRGRYEIECELSNASAVIGGKAHGAVNVNNLDIEIREVPAVPTFDVRWANAVWAARNVPNGWTIWPKRAYSMRCYLNGKPNIVAKPDWREKFGPAQMKMPRSSFVEPDRAGALNAALANGTAFTDTDTEDGAILFPPAPWRPWGPIDPGAPAGSLIEFGAWREEPEFALTAHMCSMDRAVFAYDAVTGAPRTADDYGAVSPDWSPNGSDPNNNELPEWKGVAVGDPLPMPPDPAHHEREIYHGLIAYAQYPTPLVKRHLVALGELSRLGFSERGPVINGAGYTATNMATYLSVAHAFPGMGIPGTFLGRQAGWVSWTTAMAYRLRPTPALKQWGLDFLALCEVAAMPTGAIQRNHEEGDGHGGGGAWNDPAHDAMQCFEFGILAHGACAWARLFGLPLPNWVRKMTHGLAVQPVVMYGWQGSFAHYFHVADVWPGAPLPLLDATPGTSADPATGHFEALCALCYSFDGDRAWLRASLPRGHRASDLPSKQAAMMADGNWSWTSELLGVLQS